MTAQEKVLMLKEAGFKKANLSMKVLLLFANIQPVKTLHFIKGVPSRLSKLNPTKQGFVAKNVFVLEVDKVTWTKTIGNG